MKNLFFFLLLMLPLSLIAQYQYVNIGMFSQAKMSDHVSGAPASINATVGYLHPLTKNLSLSANAMYFYARSATFDSLIRKQNNISMPSVTFDVQDGIKRAFTTSTFFVSIGVDRDFYLENKNKIGLQTSFGMAYIHYEESLNVKIKNNDGVLLFEAEDFYNFKPKIQPMMTLGINIGRAVKSDLDITVGMKYMTNFSKNTSIELQSSGETTLIFFPNQVDTASLANHRQTIGEQQRHQFLSMEIGFRYRI